MAQLAIRGHATRGREVIKLLEMLGGKNTYNYDGTDECYVIDYKKICTIYPGIAKIDGFVILTLEEFIKKFPYKVGDRVVATASNDIFIDIIGEMKWEGKNNTILYVLQNIKVNVYPERLQPCKEPMEEKRIPPYMDYDVKAEESNEYDKLDFEQEPCADKVELVLGNNYEIKVEDGKTYVVRKKPQYPRTYEECCEILDISLDNGLCISTHRDSDYISTQEEKLFDKINSLYKLIICRNAYWKIAGEEMGLGKPWEPDWSTDDDTKYVIEVYRNNVRVNSQCYSNTILAFPFVEMRDAFKENFDKDLEFCKELL